MLLWISVASASYQTKCSAKVQVTAHEEHGPVVWVTGEVLSSAGSKVCLLEGEHTWVMQEDPVPIGEIAVLRILYSDGIPVDGVPDVNRHSHVVEHYPKPTRCEVRAEVIREDHPTRFFYMTRSEATMAGCPKAPYGGVPLDPEPWMRERQTYDIEMENDVWSVVTPAEPPTCRVTVHHVGEVLGFEWPPTLACYEQGVHTPHEQIGWVPGLPEAPFEVERNGDDWHVDERVLDGTGRRGTCYAEGTVAELDGDVARIDLDEVPPCDQRTPVGVALYGEAVVGGRYRFKLPHTTTGNTWVVDRELEPEPEPESN